MAINDTNLVLDEQIGVQSAPTEDTDEMSSSTRR